MPVNTAEQCNQFLSIFSQLDRETEEWGVTIAPYEKTRNDAQNKLLWHWNKEVEQQKSIRAKFVHGQSKKDILLPLMKSWGGNFLARANHIDDILESIPVYEHKVSICYDMVRTRSPHLSVKRFAEYLNQYSEHWSANGVSLTTSIDLYHDAMVNRR